MAAEGFDQRARPNGDVAIFQHGKLVKLIRGADAKKLTTALGKKDADAQALLADAAGGGGASKPGGGPLGGGRHLGGDGRSHAHGEFRRKSG